MFKTTLRFSVLALAMFAASAQAESVTLTFDDLSSPGDALAKGFQLQKLGQHHAIYFGTAFTPVSPNNTGILAYYALDDQSELISLAPGRTDTFALNSLDLAGLMRGGGFQLNDTLSIQITGTKVDGTVVSASQRLSLTAGQFTTYGSPYFNGFTGLTSIKLSGTGTNNARYVGVDNVSFTITPVPEPETYALLLAGLGVVAAVARKRKTA